jgi:hypothetical protein
MSGRIPASARSALERGTLCHLAARTAHGPHLTPVVFAYQRGRLWVTTARSSVKARAWRGDPSVAGLVRAGGVAVAFRGRVRTYDALDPLSWPAAAVAAPSIARAALGFSMKNARFFAGYAVDARRVPFAWTPPGRVFAGIDMPAGRVLDVATGRVVAGWGPWPEEDRPRRRRRSATPGPAAPSRWTAAVERRVPRPVRDAVRHSREGTLAVDAGGELTVVPSAWRRVPSEGTYEATVAGSSVGPAAGWSGPAALTIDHASAWRASEMAGIMLQGRAEVSDGPGSVEALRARVHPSRVVWWEGWTSGTVAPREASSGSRRPRP